MSDTPVTAQVHQSLDVHRRFTTQVTLDGEGRNGLAEFLHFRFCEVLDLRSLGDVGCLADLLCSRVSNTVDRRQGYHDVLVQRNVYACYTCHLINPLALPGT